MPISVPETPKTFVRISPLSSLSTHLRYHLTLRTLHPPITYHRLLLFRLSSLSASTTPKSTELYCMEATCPHLGAPLSHAPLTGEAEELDLEQEVLDMEDVVDTSAAGRVITCPWHRYDFDLRDGSSQTGISVCVYEVQVRPSVAVEGEWDVWMEEPEIEGGDLGGWEVAVLRPISSFTDPPTTTLPTTTLPTTPSPPSLTTLSVTPPQPTTLSKTLISSALLILQTSSPLEKVRLTHLALKQLQSGGFGAIKPTKGDVKAARVLLSASEDGEEGEGCGTGFTPPREGLEQVSSFGGPKRGKGGSEKSRILMLHALANIEQWAIDLAWDIIARFSNIDMPIEFFLDFAQMAADEAKHFGLLEGRLRELGSYYGAHSIHASLWESALLTSTSLLSRLAIIHLVAEARGLDVNPLTIEKFRKVGDAESVAVLEEIHADEITHVTTGHRWFTYLCQQRSLPPIPTFRTLVRQNFKGKLKGPFNEEDRARAGMAREYYEELSGEMGWGGDAGGKGKVVREGEGDERIHPRLT